MILLATLVVTPQATMAQLSGFNINEVHVLEGLLQKVHGACLHRPDAGRNVAVTQYNAP